MPVRVPLHVVVFNLDDIRIIVEFFSHHGCNCFSKVCSKTRIVHVGYSVGGNRFNMQDSTVNSENGHRMHKCGTYILENARQ